MGNHSWFGLKMGSCLSQRVNFSCTYGGNTSVGSAILEKDPTRIVVSFPRKYAETLRKFLETSWWKNKTDFGQKFRQPFPLCFIRREKWIEFPESNLFKIQLWKLKKEWELLKKVQKPQTSFRKKFPIVTFSTSRDRVFCFGFGFFMLNFVLVLFWREFIPFLGEHPLFCRSLILPQRWALDLIWTILLVA